MAIGFGVAVPKPEPRKRVKRQKDFREAVVKKAIRAQCVERDGYCRYAKESEVHTCGGPSEWAHFGDWRRARTRGMSPESRHCTQGSLMLCKFAHDMYDAGDLVIEVFTEQGCNGPMHFRNRVLKERIG